MRQNIPRSVFITTRPRENLNDVLFWSAQHNDVTLVLSLLEEYGVDINAENSLKQMALFGAAFSGNRAMIELLLKKGIRVDHKDQSNDTALSSCVIGLKK